jgi:hypothetical protein
MNDSESTSQVDARMSRRPSHPWAPLPISDMPPLFFFFLLQNMWQQNWDKSKLHNHNKAASRDVQDMGVHCKILHSNTVELKFWTRGWYIYR